jgi:hypothetical protein
VKHRTLFVSIFILLLLVSPAAAQISPTEFTNQGTLKDGANPANANYDYEFALFNSQQFGTQAGPTITRNAVAVANGIFTVRLDFGPVFTGVDRYLQIRVKPVGAGVLTSLVPRQAITAAPYSITATDATNLNIARLIVPSTSLTATGTPVVNSGFITSATITANGSGYQTPPSVTVNDASGVGAVITATITDGLVTNLTVQNPGSGYSAAATLTIDPPPSNASQTFVTPNVFTGVNTMNNANNTFGGSFTGNGAGLTSVNAENSVQLGGLPSGRYVQSDENGNVSLGGNLIQPRDKGGSVKAMMFVSFNGAILRCYNGVTGAATGNCGFTASVLNAVYDLHFGFTVNDRFVVITPYNFPTTAISATYETRTTIPDLIIVFTKNPSNVGVADGFNIIVY